MTRWVIVGGGAAGCVIAARLSEDERNEVVLVEEGPDHGPVPVPGDVGPLLVDPGRLRFDAVVRRRPGGPDVRYPQGFGLGGSSLVNGSVVVDGPGVETGHALPLQAPWAIGPVGDALLRAESAAAPLRLVRRDRERVTAADAYLRPAAERGNLRIVVGRRVTRIALDSRRAIGVVTGAGDEITADRVVVCAGAIHTPTILLRSGVDTPGIGAGVQDHPAVSVALQLADGGADPAVPSISVSADRPGRQLLAVDHLPGATGFGAMIGAITAVASRGSVTLPDPDGPPLVQLGQLTESDDLDAMVGVVRAVLETLRHPALRAVVEQAYVDDEGTPVDRLADDPDVIRRWLPGHIAGYQHVASSCRAGVVADDTGAVLGYEGLLVGDASLFPAVPAVNPYLAVVTQAERLAAAWRDSTPG